MQSIHDETPAHNVRISRDFWLGATEVTQGQWLKMMGTRPGPNALWRRADRQRFIPELNAREKTKVYRLPSEAKAMYQKDQ